MKKEAKKVKSAKSSISKKAIEKSKTPKIEKKELKKHFSFGKRLALNIFLFLIFVIPCLYVATKTIEREKTTPINYSDVNNVSYKVYLKANDFYREKYLEMNRAYVASLIDYIDIDYNYIFNIEKITNMNFDYKVIAELILENAKGTSFVDEKYIIKDSTKRKLNNGGTLNIDENVKIDYSYYNRLANKFKIETGVDINGYLNVYLEVNKKTDENLNYKINENVKSNIKIPLSERAIEINFDSNNDKIYKQVTPVGNIKFNLEYLIVEIMLLIISAIFLARIINYLLLLSKTKTPYDKYVNKLLKDYDRLVVETKTNIELSKYNVIKINNFNELLDVRDNLKLPIIYYNIVKHEKGIFYIKNNLDVYSYVVKGIDLK